MTSKLVVSGLLGTDRILQRWAVSIGDGLHDAAWTEVPRSKVPVLPDQLAIVVDQLILRSPPRTRELTELWYRTPMTREVLATRLHIHRDTVYARWNASLYFFKARFESSPLSELRRLCLTEVPHTSVATTPTNEYNHQMDWASCRSA